jgi:hypothetical protein
MRQTSTDQFKGAEANLESKKTKLFIGRNIEKWGTKSSDFREPIETVLNDYKVARKYIMPKETEKLESVKQLSNFINQSVYYEYVLFNRRDGRRIVKNFNKYAKKVSRATQSEDIIWNIFEKERPEDQDPNEYPGKAHSYQGPQSDVLADLDRNLEQALNQEANDDSDNEGGILN